MARRGLAPFALEQERSIADQVDLGSLTRLVLTHLHFDHAGGLALVPDSVPIVHPAGRMGGRPRRRRGLAATSSSRATTPARKGR